MHIMNLSAYKTFLFDCDGVILNSNPIKTRAFYTIALPFGEDAAEAMIAYHVQNGGISRYHKIDYFLDCILSERASNACKYTLLTHYANEVKNGLLQCDVVPDLPVLRARTEHARWYVVSGGDQVELRDVFSARKLDYLFDGGIYGSPTKKEEILAALEIEFPALLLGDSRYDHQAAMSIGADFIFVSAWTEFEGWRMYCKEHNLVNIERVSSLL